MARSSLCGLFAVAAACFAARCTLVSAHASFRAELPNAEALVSIGLAAIGHKSPQGKDQLNWFGMDFAGHGYQWTVSLCRLDSDSDGQSNGLELGDPECTWVKDGGPPAFSYALSHPGDALSTTNRTASATAQANMISHLPIPKHSGWMAFSAVLVPLFLAAIAGMVFSHVSAARTSAKGKKLMRDRVGIPGGRGTSGCDVCGCSNAAASRRSGSKKSISSHMLGELNCIDWILDLRMGELLFLIAVAAGLLALIIMKQGFKHRAANTIGQLASTLCFLVILPTTRSSLWVVVFGIPFERAIKWHRLFGKLFLVSVYLHIIVLVWRYGTRVITATLQWGPSKDAPVPIYGLIAGIGVTAISLTAFEAVRRRSYEVFYYVHIPSVILIAVMSILHAPGLEYRGPVAFSLVLWQFDNLHSWLCRSRRVERVDVDTVGGDGSVVKLRVTLRRPLSTGPGDYCYLRFPQISRLQNHPFSISSRPSSKELTFHIKDMGPRTLTHSLRLLCQSSSSPRIDLGLEGPYGHLSLRMTDYECIWICAGGIGASPMINILLHLKSHIKSAQYRRVQHVHFCWVVRAAADLLWFKEEIDSISNSDMSEWFSFHLFVTGSKSAEEHASASLAANFGQAGHSDIGVGSPQEIEVEIELPGVDAAEAGSEHKASPKQDHDDSHAGLQFQSGRPRYHEIFGPAVAPPDAALLACGPASMVADAQRAALMRGWNVHKETFLF